MRCFRKSNVLWVLAAVASLAAAGCGGNGGGGAVPATPTVSSGMIAGTGSIVVNGVEYDTSNARVFVDGVLQADDNELKLGNFVTVTGALTSPTGGYATEVRLSAEVRGTASGAAAGNATFTVLGQAVTATPATLFDNTAATPADLSSLNGLYVEVHGALTNAGAIRATRIEVREPAGLLDELKGTVAHLDSATAPGTFRIGGQAVSFDNATLFVPAGAAIDNGSFVEVRGTVSAGVLVAAEIEVEDLASKAEGMHVELKGTVSALDNAGGTFDLSGGAGTVPVSFLGLTAAGIANGAVVEAEGTMVAGVLRATEVRVENEIEAVNPVKLSMLVDNVTVSSATSGTFYVADFVQVQVTAATVLVGATDMNDFAARVAAAIGQNSDIQVEVVGAAAGPLAVAAAEVRIVDLGTREYLQAPVTAHDAGTNPVTLEMLGITVDTTLVSQFRNAASNPIPRAEFFGLILDGTTVVKIESGGQAAGFTPPSTIALPTGTELEIEPLG